MRGARFAFFICIVTATLEEPRTERGGESSADTSTVETPKQATPRRRRTWRSAALSGLLFLVVLLVLGRMMLPWAVRSYVNRTIDQNPLYDGKVGEIEISLWRGAYTIHDIRLIKTTGNVPVPLFSSKRMDLAIEWPALWAGEIVGRVAIDEPEINFVDAAEPEKQQTGGSGPWLEIIRDLFPFKINSLHVNNGSIHLRMFEGKEPFDVFMNQLNASITNLTNIHDEVTPLVSTVEATARVMGAAPFEYKMKFDPFSYRPTFQMAVRLLELDVTKINQLTRAYGAFDFERGWFDLVVEVEAKEGRLSGYVKPLFRQMRVLSLRQDIKEDNVIEFFWEALLGVASGILKNQPRDQFGTIINFSGDLSNPKMNLLEIVGNVLYNAFVRAYLPRLHGEATQVDWMQFSPGTISDPVAPITP
jgi:hypothetical protein